MNKLYFCTEICWTSCCFVRIFVGEKIDVRYSIYMLVRNVELVYVYNYNLTNVIIMRTCNIIEPSLRVEW